MRDITKVFINMKSVLFAISFSLFTTTLFSQVAKYAILNRDKISDSIVKETGEIKIFNTLANPICVRVSYAFLGKILSKDTVELGALGFASGGCPDYDLWISNNDLNSSVNDIPRFPLIINPRTCLVATVSLIRDLRCQNPAIQYSFINDPSVDYNELVNQYNRHQLWDVDSKIIYRKGRIQL